MLRLNVIRRAPIRGMSERLRLRHLLAALPVLLALAPAAAGAVELQVRVSKTIAARYESVAITVTDPLGGRDVDPGPLVATMADSRDWRQTVHLEPGTAPGTWSGRFTPLGAGRYTGTAVLERDGATEIGLVPLVRVRAGSHPGFLRLHSSSRRVLAYSGGTATLFPIGIRVHPDDLYATTDWTAELEALRKHGVNFLDVPVAWGDDLTPEAADIIFRSVDSLLLAAERAGGIAVQLRLQPPVHVAGDPIAAYEEHLARCARRWSYSPALATWYLAGATAELPAEERTRLVRAVRTADSYRHPIAVPAADGRLAGADLALAPAAAFRSDGPVQLLEDPESDDVDTAVSPWRMLVTGGLGLPLAPCRLGGADAAVLERLARLAEAARTVPFHAAPTTSAGDGLFRRYGTTLLGWVTPERERAVMLPVLPRGRFKVLLRDPETGAVAREVTVSSTGGSQRLELPEGTRAAYLQAAPVPSTVKAVRKKTTKRRSTARKSRRRR